MQEEQHRASARDRARSALWCSWLPALSTLRTRPRQQTLQFCDELLAKGVPYPTEHGFEGEAARDAFYAELSATMEPKPSPELMRAVFETPGLWMYDRGFAAPMFATECAHLLEELATKVVDMDVGWDKDDIYAAGVARGERYADAWDLPAGASA